MSRSLMILFMVSVDAWLNENLLLICNLFFIPFMLWWKTIFLIMDLIMSFPDDILVSSDQLKRFDESVVDPKCLLRIYATSFCFGKNLSSSSNIIFSCILHFYLRSTVCMLCKMVWNYHQHDVCQSTAIWLVYSDLPPGTLTYSVQNFQILF